MLILRSNRVVLPTGERAATLHIADGVIRKVGAHDDVPANAELRDYGEAAISPGAIDVHVHANEPGRTSWEGLETASRAAIAGGITTFIEMPLNSDPVTTSVAALELKLAAARSHLNRSLRCDVGFWCGLVHGNAADIAPMLDAGALGAKAFLVNSGLDDFSPARDSDLRAAMPVLAERGLPLLVHCELEAPQPPTDAPRSYDNYLNSRPPAWELRAIEMMIALCREFCCRVHIVHLGTAQALPMLRAAKIEGLPLTVETCPHYLMFAAEDINDGDTLFKCAPPIRDGANREQLWQGLRDGTIDFVASDHSPCLPALKLMEEGDFARAWGGISGLQWLTAATWTEAKQRGFSLRDLARWTSERPAQLLSKPGEIAVGNAANLCVWEPEQTFTVTTTEHRHKISPYMGRELSGIVRATYLRGGRVYEDGKFGNPVGQII